MPYPSTTNADPLGKLLRVLLVVVVVWLGFSWLGSLHRLAPVVVTGVAVANLALAWMIHQRSVWLDHIVRFGWLQRYIAWVGTLQGESRYSDPASVVASPEILLRSPRDFLLATQRAQQVVRGHDQVLAKVLSSVRDNLQLRKSRRPGTTFGPVASLLLVGPEGVGKRHLVRVVAKLLYRHAPVAVFPCDQITAETLVGGWGQPGVLLEETKKQPFQVILFEQVDRAGHEVVRLLEQVLTTGVFRSPQSRTEVSFRNTVVFCTLSRESTLLEELCRSDAGAVSEDTRARETLRQESRLSPGLLNAINDIGYCSPPTDEVKAEVLALLMKKHCRDQQVELVHADPEVLVAQVDRLDESDGNFTNAAGQVDRLLNKPLVATLSAKQTQLALRVQRKQPLAIGR